MSTQILTYISLGIGIIGIGLSTYAVWTTGQARSFRKILSGENPEEMPQNLEDIILKISQRLKMIDDNNLQTAKTLQAIIDQLNTATQHVGIVRYNSNGDDGGNLSFSTALLDAHQSGIVITSLHGRQNNRIYAKIITAGASEQTLSDEEKEALIQALTKNKLSN